RERQLGGGAAKRVRLDHLAQRDRLALGVGDLDTHRRLAGEAVDPDRLGLDPQTEIVDEVRDLRVLDPRVRLELGRGHDRPWMDLADAAVNVELGTTFRKAARALHQLRLVDVDVTLGRGQEADLRERVLAPTAALDRGGACRLRGWLGLDRLLRRRGS